jgi:hypothetical protein
VLLSNAEWMPSYLRTAAAEALGRIGGPDALQVLSRAQFHVYEEPDVAPAVTAALTRFREAAAQSILQTIAGDDRFGSSAVLARHGMLLREQDPQRILDAALVSGDRDERAVAYARLARLCVAWPLEPDQSRQLADLAITEPATQAMWGHSPGEIAAGALLVNHPLPLDDIAFVLQTERTAPRTKSFLLRGLSVVPDPRVVEMAAELAADPTQEFEVRTAAFETATQTGQLLPPAGREL